MIFLRILAFLVITATIHPAMAIEIKSFDSNEVLLPSQKTTNMHLDQVLVNPDDQNKWDLFRQKHGKWTIVFDNASGNVHKAFGEAIKIDGYNRINEDNVQQAAETFLNNNAGTFGIQVKDLNFVNASLANKRWYVNFRQVHKGLEVLLSDISLVIFENGNLMSFGLEHYNNIDVNTKPSINVAAANTKASIKLDNVLSSENMDNNTQYILPVRNGNLISYKLVTKFTVQTKDNSYTSFVDSHTGSVIWRVSNNFHAATTLTAKGSVNKILPLDKETVHPFMYQEITIDGKKTNFDSTGSLKINVEGSAQYSTRMVSPWVTIKNKQSSDANKTGTITEGKSLEILWDNSNSNRFERNIFYHTNIVHDFLVSIDPACTAMNFSIPVNLYPDDPITGRTSPNAFFSSSSRSISFINLKMTQYQLAGSGSVLYHEYGHAINHYFYQQRGKGQGMINKSTHEALADINSALLLDLPKVGEGVFKNEPKKIIRNVDNTNKYPEDIKGESHYDGQILAGAFWDLRESIGLKLARKLSHFAKYSTPDDPNTGKAFFEWFVATIEADDNDGNLGNGTPHLAEIITAFNNHKIGLDFVVGDALLHTPHKNTKETKKPYTLNCTYNSSKYAFLNSENIAIEYMINAEKKINTVPMSSNNSAAYTGAIPAQKSGTMLKYRFKMKFKNVDGYYYYPSGKDEYFIFLVNYKSIFADNFETDKNWTLPSDQMGGDWEIAAPKKAMYGSTLIQPNILATPESKKCLVTDARGGSGFGAFSYALQRTSIVTSPVIDFSNASNPLLSFKIWKQSLMNPGQLQIFVTTNKGGTWQKIKTYTETFSTWTNILLPLDPSLASKKEVQIRFLADAMGSSQGFAAMEVLIDDLEILSAPGINSVEDKFVTDLNISSFPNPTSFNNKLSYNLNNASMVSINIYDNLGKHIVNLENKYQTVGLYNYTWNLKNAFGLKVAQGVYFYQLKINDRVVTRKLIIQ